MESRERIMLTFMLLLGVLAVNGNSTEPFSVRLEGGSSRCQGQVQVQREGSDWIGVNPGQGAFLAFGNRICAELDCGSALTVEKKSVLDRPAVVFSPDRCRGDSLKDCFTTKTYNSVSSLELSCSDSLRLDGPRSLCSGSLKFKGQPSDQSWTEVCEGALDRRGAEVVCRELGCGAPLLQGALSPLRQMFHCEGNESALIDCPRNLTNIREPCSPLQLTCSEPMKLLDGLSRCEGYVDVKYEGEWRRLGTTDTWTTEGAAGVCQDLDCGSVVFAKEVHGLPNALVWFLKEKCVKEATVRDCVDYGGPTPYTFGVKVVCSGMLKDLQISASDGSSGAELRGPQLPSGSSFWVNCSVESGYPGGYFQLLAPIAHNQTLPPDNSTAAFLFTNAGTNHSGNYSCVYHLPSIDRGLAFRSPPLQLQLLLMSRGKGETNQAALLTQLISLLLGVAAGHMI